MEDALSATRAAVEEGIVAGGGSTLIRAAVALDALNVESDEATGIRIVRKSLEEPIRIISNNSGMDGSVILDSILKGENDYGYDAEIGEFGSMFEMGIVDPAKVTRVRPGECRKRGNHDPNHGIHGHRDSQEGTCHACRSSHGLLGPAVDAL